jgi:hypothetical protein
MKSLLRKPVWYFQRRRKEAALEIWGQTPISATNYSVSVPRSPSPDLHRHSSPLHLSIADRLCKVGFQRRNTDGCHS